MTTHEHVTDAGDSPTASTPTEVINEKEPIGAHVETIHTNERVPGNTHYYEKDGLRTYGDEEDHDHEPPVSLPSRRTSHELC